MNYHRGYGGYNRGYPSSKDSRRGKPHEDDCESIRRTQDYKKIKDLFYNGNFSEVRKDLNKHRKEIECLYLELKHSASKFEEWDERDVIRNAAIISAHAVLKELKTTQIRKIIEMARRLHTEVSPRLDIKNPTEKIKKDALRMNMLMAYYAGKNKSVLPLQEVLEPVLNWLSDNPTPENFEKVYTFFEAIVAYHRYFGGKD